MAGKKKEFTVVTHAGKFHADDIFAVATLSLLFEKKKWKMRLIRTLDPAWFKKADFVLDIGRVYNAKKNRFDHHQRETAGKRKNGILYATFGLIWKHFGLELISNKKAAEIFDQKLVAPLDAADIGVNIYKNLFDDLRPVTIDGYISTESIGILDMEQEKEKAEIHKLLDTKFKELELWAKEVIKAYIYKAEIWVNNEKTAKAAYRRSKDKRLIVLDHYLGFDFSEFKEPLIFVFPDMRGRWSAKTVGVKGENFKDRIYFPTKWRGKVDQELARASGVEDAVFCHNTGFLAVAVSKEGAIELAKKAIKANQKK